MPANKKHLTRSPWQRFLKITAGIIGGYLVTTTFHFFLMLFLEKKDVFVTMFFSTYILWAILMIFAFLAKNGWKIWGYYTLISVLLSAPYMYEMVIKH